jgi:flagellar biosynthesis/type III secretory pathway protein FliH
MDAEKVPARRAFVPADSIRRADASAVTAFAARHFAVRRAGFLLREYARQQQPEEPSVAPPDAPSPESAEGSPDAGTDGTATTTQEELERLLAEAEQRGRDAAQAEFVAALDQAMAALESVGRAVAETHADLERRLVVPLAQASFRIGNELARQTLSDGAGLGRYLEAVVAAVDLPTADTVLEVRMNPQDLDILGRSRTVAPSLRLIADPLVPRAGAIASSADKVVDDRFENRIRATQEAVLAAAADLLRETPA